MNVEEEGFMDECSGLGFRTFRRGFPDFMLEDDNEFFFVEIKSGIDKVSKDQDRTFKALQRAGFKVYLCFNGDMNMVVEYDGYSPKTYLEYLQNKDCRMIDFASEREKRILSKIHSMLERERTHAITKTEK